MAGTTRKVITLNISGGDQYVKINETASDARVIAIGAIATGTDASFDLDFYTLQFPDNVNANSVAIGSMTVAVAGQAHNLAGIDFNLDFAALDLTVNTATTGTVEIHVIMKS